MADTGLLALAVALGTWAHLPPSPSGLWRTGAPSYGGYFAIALGVFAILGAGYWLYEKGHFSPVPGDGKAA